MTVCVEADVLVLGCGIAGGTAALLLAEAGLSVVVVTRASDPEESNTHYAQGGIVYRGEGDSPERLQEDVFHAGAGHCYPPSVRILAEEGPGLVEKILLDKLKVAFDRTSDGTLSLAREGSHSLPRILHAADTTGKAIEEELVKALREQPNVTLLTRHTAVDLLTPSHHSLNRLAVYEPNSCVGAYLLDQEKGLIFRCVAKKTILATGGLGQIFLRTSNPKGARGDGLAMANRAGARIINAEFVQFHPTTFHAPPAPNFLISEAVRVVMASGAKDVIVAATHGVLSDPAQRRLSECGAREVIVTDTLPITSEKRFNGLTILPIAPLIARAIREVFDDGSVTSLFDGAS